MINIDKIYDLMSDKGFQEPRTGNLFFPAYIYTYPPEKEYEIREQIILLTEKLKRPNQFLDCLVINLYEELINYLKQAKFAGKPYFDLIMEKEKESPDDAMYWIKDRINKGFYPHIEKKVKEHFDDVSDKRVYLIIHGVGNSYPYLRASEFLKNTESLIKEFKVLLFYPGNYEDAQYRLFGILDDDNLYRANNLNRQLGE